MAFSAGSVAHLQSALVPRLSCSNLSSPQQNVHARILAIRVEFQPDTLSTTTGNGTFNSGIPQDIVADPLPHDRAYFEDHLQFLDNYFTEVSSGMATVDTFAIFPEDPAAAYQLPHQMWHYNYNSTQEDLNMRLAWLFRDAWEAAANDTAIHPENFDTFFIFHAGIGQDFQVGFDETPHDIPSAYFTLADLRQALGDPNYPGVSVNGTYVGQGLLLPESEHQSEVDVEIALNGTEALLFAHSLGLPALYNTDNGLSGVGRFDLMDQGSGNFAGMVPARPCAWSRAFMGWETPYMLQPGAQQDTFKVNIAGYSSPAVSQQGEIFRLNQNESEYLLIENRSYDPDSLGYTYAYDRQNRRLKISLDYSVEVLDGGFGVIVSVDNYDFGIPGEGILVWHVDDEVILSKYSTNQVNADLAHRGVELLEADAAQDIGQSYGFLDVGWGTEYGWAGDFFFSGNVQFLAANPNINSVTLYDDSYPGTRTHDGSATGISIGGFSDPDTVMSFWVQNTWAQIGFPRALAQPSGGFSPSVLDFDGDGQTDWIFAATPGGAVQAFDTLGRAQGSVIESRWLVGLLGDSTQVFDTLLVKLDSLAATPAIDATAEGFRAILPSTSNKVYLLSFLLASGTLALDSVFLDSSTSCLPLIAGSSPNQIWYLGDNSGKLYAFDENNELLLNIPLFAEGPILGLCALDTSQSAAIFALSGGGGAALVNMFINANTPSWIIELPFDSAFPPIAQFHPADSRLDLVAVGSGGEVALLNSEDGSLRVGFPFNCGMSVSAPTAAADFDYDGRLEVVLLGENRILAVAPNGVLSANWPLIMDATRSYDPIQSPPAISEITLDGELRVLFGWPGGSVEAGDRWGSSPDSFPYSTGGTIRSAPLLVQMDSDAESELLVLDEKGYLYCWQLEQLGYFANQRRPWNGLQNGNRRLGLALDSVQTIPPDQSILVSTKVYPWPNPAREVSHIRFKMGQTGTITVRIFDGAGDLVKELKGTGQADLESELDWDLAEVTSGVYLGRVEAEANGKTERTFIKIAVVK